MEQTMQQRRRRRAFTPAFKAEVVELCRRGSRSIPEVARDLDLTETAVRRWVTQAEIDRGSRPGLTSSEQAELAQLRRENRQLREDLGIMKRAAAFMWTLRLWGYPDTTDNDTMRHERPRLTR